MTPKKDNKYNYNKCANCGTIYQKRKNMVYNASDDDYDYKVDPDVPWVGYRCRTCDSVVHFQNDTRGNYYCYRCSKYVLPYECCPKCGSSKYNPLTDADCSSCFITTACIVSKNLPDNCHELETLRKWRDQLAGEDKELAKRVEEYYLNAPKIVQAINSLENAKEIYESLYENLVCKTVKYLEEGNIKMAIENYISIYEALKKQYL